jgi:hypothetical protein
MTRRCMMVCAAAVAAWAQVEAPLLGYLADSGQIRTIYGIPAAAAVGEPAAGGQRFARLAAGREFVIASDEGGRVMVFSGGALRPLEGAGVAPDTIILSPSGSAALLWFASISRAQIVRGLPGEPSLRNVDTPFRPSLPALAVSDDGAWIAGAWPDGLYAFGPHGERTALPLAGRMGALAFAPGAHDLAAANAAGIHLITGVDSRASVATVFGAEDLMPVGVAIAGDRVLAAGQRGALVAVDPGSGARSVIECHCRPEGLYGVSPGLFRLTGLEDGAVRLFDAASNQILFAPLALREGGER